MENEFAEPAGATNFLERYRQARNGSSPNTTPKTGPMKGLRAQAPASPSSPRSSKSKDVWSSVFHPLGKPSTKADRYDLGKKASPAGESVSEIHARGIATIHLDQPAEE